MALYGINKMGFCKYVFLSFPFLCQHISVVIIHLRLVGAEIEADLFLFFQCWDIPVVDCDETIGIL